MKEIKFTSSPWGFRFYSWEEYCEVMKSLGITDVCGMFVDPKKLPLSFSDNMSEEEIQKVLSITSEKGVRIIEVAGGGDFTANKGLDQQIKRTKKQIDLGAKFGIKFFRLFAGWMKREFITEKIYHQVAESLREIGNYASNYNIVIAMENEGGITTRGEEVEKIMRLINLDNVGVNYDPANFLYYGEDPLKALDTLLPYIVFTHLKNCKIVNGEMEYCRLKEGVINYKRLFKKLRKGYSGYYGLEYENAADVNQGTKDDLTFLKSVLL